MKILAIDSSTERCSVAVGDGSLIHSVEASLYTKHSESVLSLVASALQHVAWPLSLIDGISFGAGPGGFTGLRIACGVSQGLAFSLGCPVAPICCLQAVATATPHCATGKFWCAIDARMGELYVAAYSCNQHGEWTCEIPPCVTAPHQAPRPHGGGWIGVGNGFSLYRETLLQRLEGSLISIGHSNSHNAIDILNLGRQALLNHQGVAAHLALPFYIRNKVAKTTAERAAARYAS